MPENMKKICINKQTVFSVYIQILATRDDYVEYIGPWGDFFQRGISILVLRDPRCDANSNAARDDRPPPRWYSPLIQLPPPCLRPPGHNNCSLRLTIPYPITQRRSIIIRPIFGRSRRGNGNYTCFAKNVNWRGRRTAIFYQSQSKLCHFVGLRSPPVDAQKGLVSLKS